MADTDGVCVTATDNDGRQTRLFLVKSGHGLLFTSFYNDVVGASFVNISRYASRPCSVITV